MPVWVELLLVAAVAALLLYLNRPRPSLLRSLGDRFARDYLLWIAPEGAAAVDDAHRVVLRGHTAATLAGLAFYGAARLVAPGQVVMWAATCAAAAVLSILRVAHAGRDFVPAAGSRAIARTRAVRLRDYLATRHLVVLWLCPVLAIGLAAGGSIAVRDAVGNPDTAWFVAVTGGALAGLGLLLPVLAALMVRRPLPAADRAHLYLQDAWRVDRLREMLWFEAFSVAMLLMQSYNLTPLYLGVWLMPALLLPVALLVFAFEFGRLHFRRRLWPDLAKGEKVVIGTTEAVA